MSRTNTVRRATSPSVCPMPSADGLEVLEALGGLLEGAALDELAGLGVEGKLGRQVVVMGERHGLRVQGACGRAFHVPCQDYVVTAH